MRWLRRSVKRSCAVDGSSARSSARSRSTSPSGRRAAAGGAADEEARRRARIQLRQPGRAGGADPGRRHRRAGSTACCATSATRSGRCAARPGFAATVVAHARGRDRRQQRGVLGHRRRPAEAAAVSRRRPAGAGASGAWTAETRIAPGRVARTGPPEHHLRGPHRLLRRRRHGHDRDLPERIRRAVVAPHFLEVWGVAPIAGPGVHRGRGRGWGAGVR